jgi:hypothetical protein
MPKVKGAAITARVRFVRERYGPEGYARLVAEAQPATRTLLEGNVLPSAWVPYEAFVDLGATVDRLFGRGDLALCLEMGRFAAEVNLPTLYRLFYRVGSTHYILRKAAQLWGLHYDSGRLAVVEEGDRGVRLEVVDYAEPNRVHCLAVLGWATRSVELSGNVIVLSEEAACRARGDESCEIVLRWR